MSLFHSRPSIGQELLDVPMGDMIREMAFAIAEAQIKLDSNSMEVAQMMGGLKTITKEINGEEVVTFQDSRVFFGQEKITVASSIELYNSTNDRELRATILSKLASTDWEEDPNKIITTTGTSTTQFVAHYNARTGNAFTNSNLTVSGKDYRLEDSSVIFKTAPTKYFSFVSISDDGLTRIYKELQPHELPIRLKNTAVEKSFFLPTRVSMLELGFSPTFYQFVDTIIEVKISIKYTQEGSYSSSRNTNSKTSGFSAGVIGIPGLGGGVAARRTVTTTQVNATYSQKYSYSAEGSSLLRTKLVPIPPPAILEERIRQQMELAKETNTTKE